MTKYSDKWKKLKKNGCESDKKPKEYKKNRIKDKKRNKNHRSTQLQPSIKYHRVHNKNSSSPYITCTKNHKKFKKSQYTIKRNPPLTNRIKTIVTYYIIIGLVLETHLVAQELGPEMITRTSPKKDKTGKSTQTGISRHRFDGTSVCDLEKGKLNQGIKDTRTMDKSNKPSVQLFSLTLLQIAR